MFPHPMSRPEFRPDDSPPDPTQALEQHLLAGFPPDLALDLVLNELVVRAAEATHASAAALALARGDEMVCRAATGQLAPDLGVPLNPRDGLSGACLQTRQPQLSVDTEFDPRIDPDISRRRGIRSILIVPVFEAAFAGNDTNAQFTGVLEVFSASPAAFSHIDQKRLEAFARECGNIRRAAIELARRKAGAPTELIPSELIPPDFVPPDFVAATTASTRRPRYEAWSLVLGGLAILATIAVSFLIGSRIGWLRRTASEVRASLPIEARSSPVQPLTAARSPATKTTTAAPSKSSTATPEDELVVYEKGKIIFRMKAAPTKPGKATSHDAIKQDSDAVVKASPTTKTAPVKTASTKIAPTEVAPAKATPRSVWLSPAQAETRLLSRTEPEYPPEAVAAHRSGDVVLEVEVAEDGSVSNVRAVSGDPGLAAAASDAVRNWRYEPFRRHDHPAQFQTDVTLTFALPN
jgi:TonB family protein